MKKLRVFEVLLQFAPAAIVSYFKFPLFVETAEKSITTAGMIMIVFALVIFRDQVKEYFQTPSVFKVSVIFFILGVAAMQFGEQLYWLSLATLGGSIAGMPLTYIRTHDNEDDELKQMFERLVKNNENNERNNESV